MTCAACGKLPEQCEDDSGDDCAKRIAKKRELLDDLKQFGALALRIRDEMDYLYGGHWLRLELAEAKAFAEANVMVLSDELKRHGHGIS